MTTCSPVPGSTANCTLLPPVSTPTRRMQANAASRIALVLDVATASGPGATVIESPVCTPIGSTFSIEQMTTQLSARSRITSSSNSFQPAIDDSMRISLMGLASRPSAAMRRNSSTRRRDAGAPAAEDVGRPHDDAAARCARPRRMASSRVWATPDAGTSRPISTMAALNRSRSSAVAMASALAPIISGVPGRADARRARTSSMARLSAVWPPSVGSTASGRSRSMISSSTSAVSGSM